MKKLHFIFIFFTVSGTLSAQYDEFKTCSNGLIYDEATMQHLGLIIDSLNLQFKSCELDRPYYSLPQGLAHYVKIPSQQARKDMRAGLDFELYRKKYPFSVKQRNVYIVQYEYEDYNGKNVLEYAGLPGSESPQLIVKNTRSTNKTSGWVIAKNHAFYLANWSTSTLPRTYARLVQYVDCMIDTTAQIYFPVAQGAVYQVVAEGSAAHQFIAWARRYPNEPQPPDYDDTSEDEWESVWQAHNEAYRQWDNRRLTDLDKRFLNNRFRQDQLRQARDEALATGNSDSELEFYVARYLTKSDALALKRSRRVTGGCSMDLSPRVHAAEICMLAAETYQWDIFLRSHLDIMNDRFDRVSDGSYAWEGRQTYLKELELLGLNTPDLLMGTCFRVNNVSEGHYFGSISRIGRALAETSEHDKVEALMFGIIEDRAVDTFNRLLFVYLFSHYNGNLTEEARKKNNDEYFKSLQGTLPTEIQQILASK
jgi:hypothetical protein